MMLGEAITAAVGLAPGSPEFYPQAEVKYTGKMCFESPWIPWVGREKTIQNVRVGDPKTYCEALVGAGEGLGGLGTGYLRIAATVALAWWLFMANKGGSK
jgi:hypothetical protein